MFFNCNVIDMGDLIVGIFYREGEDVSGKKWKKGNKEVLVVSVNVWKI